MKCTYDGTNESSIFLTNGPENYKAVPIFNKIGENAEIKIEFESTYTQALSIQLVFLFFNKNEIDIATQEKLNMRRAFIKQSSNTTILKSHITIWENNTGHNVYIPWLDRVNTLPYAIQLWNGNKKIFNKGITGNTSDSWERKVYTHTWVKAGDKLWADISPGEVYALNNWSISPLLTDTEFLADELPYISPYQYKHFGEVPILPVLTENTKPMPPSLPTPINNTILPYITQIDIQNELIPSIPPRVNIKTTTKYNKAGAFGSKLITLPDETRTVEGVISPFGVLRKGADVMGRLRTTESAINYKAGTLNTTDTNAHTIFTGHGTKGISLYAKTLDFKIRILTLYDWLAGKTITDEDYIFIDAGQTLNLNIEAKELEITATAATASEIYWTIEL